MQAMVAIQKVDRKVVFSFVEDFPCHHTQWLGSARTDLHGLVALDFSSLTDYQQLVANQTYRGGVFLDLFFTNLPNFCSFGV